jgi:hypothetical protein
MDGEAKWDEARFALAAHPASLAAHGADPWRRGGGWAETP